MTWLAVFAPSRLARLFAADIMNVSRDPMLLFAFVLSLLPSLGLYLGRNALDAKALEMFGLGGLSTIIAPMALVLPATLTGWVTGFLLLEDRDDGPLLAIDVTPVGKVGFLAYRVAVTGLAAALITLVAVSWLLPIATDHSLVVAMVAVEAVIAAIALPAFARNKVEGLALTKLTNLLAVAPLLALIPSPWRYIGGLLPSFWLGELLIPATPMLDFGQVVLLGSVVHAVWLAGLIWIFSRKIG